MTAIKRLDDTLLAFARLRDSGVDATLCLVGDGPDRAAVEGRLSELGIARDTLLLVGYQRDVGAVSTRSSTRCCCRRRTKEPRSSRSRRLPRTAGGRDARRGRAGCRLRRRDGLLVAVGDIDGLAAALGRLAADPELRRQMGEAGRERTPPRYRGEPARRRRRRRCTASCSASRVWRSRRHPHECGERGLLLTCGCQQSGLPAVERRLVLEARTTASCRCAGSCARSRTPGSDRLPASHRDAEEPVGRVGLVAVLGDPESLVAVEAASAA